MTILHYLYIYNGFINYFRLPFHLTLVGLHLSFSFTEHVVFLTPSFSPLFKLSTSPTLSCCCGCLHRLLPNYVVILGVSTRLPNCYHVIFYFLTTVIMLLLWFLGLYNCFIFWHGWWVGYWCCMAIMIDFDAWISRIEICVDLVYKLYFLTGV